MNPNSIWINSDLRCLDSNLRCPDSDITGAQAKSYEQDQARGHVEKVYGPNLSLPVRTADTRVLEFQKFYE